MADQIIQAILKDYYDSWNEGFIRKNGDNIRNFFLKTLAVTGQNQAA